MVSDSELAGRLREFLRISDLNTTTTAAVRRKLEEDFGIDLSHKKAFIREQVDLYLDNEFENAEKNEADDGEGEVVEGDDEEEEEEEEEESNNRKSSAKRGSNKQNKETKKRTGGGFTKLCKLSPELQKFTGVPELARTEVVKQLWNYIRENNMQDPSNRRNIICDDNFQALFGVESIDMFQMNKALAKHIWPLDSDGATVKITQPKEKQRKQEREDPDEPQKQVKRQKGGTSGFLAPLQLSDALVKFIGTGETALSRSDVVKRIWDYIKKNDLQDPSDKRMIISDEKLKELFEVESFNGFTVSKLLKAHFIKTEK